MYIFAWCRSNGSILTALVYLHLYFGIQHNLYSCASMLLFFLKYIYFFTFRYAPTRDSILRRKERWAQHGSNISSRNLPYYTGNFDSSCDTLQSGCRLSSFHTGGSSSGSSGNNVGMMFQVGKPQPRKPSEQPGSGQLFTKIKPAFTIA